MNIDHLRTFQEVVRLGSFSEVAKKLAISQPAVSFQIQRLEQELGIRLIDRSQRSVKLTAAGKRILRFAESVEAEREQLRHDLEQMREDISGEILITASTIPGEYLLPPFLAKFKQQNPAVKIQVDVSDSLTVINGIRNNLYEVGFCGMLPDGNDLASFKFFEDEIVLIVFPEHAFTHQGEVTPGDLESEPFIFRESSSGTQRNLESQLSLAGLDIGKWTPHLVLGSTQAVISAVAAGAGIAFVSNIAIKKGRIQGPVKQIPLSGIQLRRDFYCIYYRERIVSRLLEEFISYIRIEASHGNKGN